MVLVKEWWIHLAERRPWYSEQVNTEFYFTLLFLQKVLFCVHCSFGLLNAQDQFL